MIHSDGHSCGLHGLVAGPATKGQLRTAALLLIDRLEQAWRVALLYQLIVCSDAGCMFCRATLREKGLP